MLGRNLLLDSLSKGYIKPEEIDFIRSFMWDNEGSILEVGAYVGKTFHYLHQHRPNWDYVGVDPWEIRPFRMTDPNIEFNRTSDDPESHSKYFKENCPFATCHVDYYENILFTKDTFDVIILSAALPNIDMKFQYTKAVREIKEDGVIIGRYLNHPKYSKLVEEAVNSIKPENFMNFNGSMFAIW